MKYIRWLESHVFAAPDEKASKQVEKKISGYSFEQSSLAQIRESFLPIASAFSSKNFAEPSVPPVTIKNETHSNAPLMSRPRPIAQNGTEKSFFSRGTIPTENINLPTRIHSNYRPSYYPKPEEKPKLKPEEKIVVKRLPERQDLIEIILEMYPSMIKYVERKYDFQRKHSSGSASTFPKSTALKSDSSHLPTTATSSSDDILAMKTIPAYVNLPTPPISPFESVKQRNVSEVNFEKVSGTIEESEFRKVQSFLIRFIDLKGNQVPKNLKIRIMECYSITLADLEPKRALLFNEEDIGKSEKCLQKLIKALETEEPEKWLETDELKESSEIKSNTLVWRKTDSTEILKKDKDILDILSPQITEGHVSDTNLVRCQTKQANKTQPALFRMTSSTTSFKKLPTFNLKKTYDKTFRNERNVIRRAVSGVLG
ncbi:hypothetical protein EPUL_006285 [Erysiphe pulchra]|uniref:Uncharacterized protein n=1 Tax=Erysiphe pulchra TaxID=225359 RepID=A0A2S4PPS8_9PEZI|nr:hypothetical protein EPUL_006285 [Erysiphe pulchra]